MRPALVRTHHWNTRMKTYIHNIPFIAALMLSINFLPENPGGQEQTAFDATTEHLALGPQVPRRSQGL